MAVRWREEDIERARYSEDGVAKHLEVIAGLQEKYFKEDRPVIAEKAEKYLGYGNYTRP